MGDSTQRGYGNYKDGWEFPGGKIEPGETPEHTSHKFIRQSAGFWLPMKG